MRALFSMNTLRVTLVSTQAEKWPLSEALLPLRLPQEGGEGWGEEAFLFRISPLPGPLPLPASFLGEGHLLIKFLINTIYTILHHYIISELYTRQSIIQPNVATFRFF